VLVLAYHSHSLTLGLFLACWYSKKKWKTFSSLLLFFIFAFSSSFIVVSLLLHLVFSMFPQLKGKWLISAFQAVKNNRQGSGLNAFIMIEKEDNRNY
jgi:uncharacterized membrane-anchored protein YitT (DUF2179 family)